MLPWPYSPRMVYSFAFTVKVSWSVQAAPGEPRTPEEQKRVRERERNILYYLNTVLFHCALSLLT